ncbi:6-phosphofructokinase isozyme 2 [Limihaloglobus sulfuriphilus]|uniref:6-phosphofructokinase isozyme 2 n=1 Tax=Limihaloglobus sulfuriphilus TaxID=1851148 RepID=A0A1Q2MHZ6_9BACT|nr:PfkB family carbohydrate kinase [Limihaloglobus sulfuriphilus]AQQ72284.1 6-phosphofructokinase isozyme 2 [Limihaloglobus sulfuriphilus]
MFERGNIITVGIRPAWDVVCSADGIEWGDHKVLDARTSVPAGKALNVSKALAWLGYPSIATGLWGQEDYDEMAEQLRPLSSFIDIRFAAVRGHTRQNITLRDTRKNREMHLRLPGTLANKGSIRRMSDQLLRMIDKDDVLVFGGSMPEGALLEEVVSLIWDCKQKHTNIILDTSGTALERLVSSGQISLISPNITELENLLNCRVKEDPQAVLRAGRRLLDKVSALIVSLGSEGAVFISRDECWHSFYAGADRDVLKTVAGGDYLLAGFIAGMKENPSPEYALTKAVRLATGFVFGLCKDHEPWQLDEMLEIETNHL